MKITRARALRIALITAATLIVAFLLALFALSQLDWNRAKPWINSKVTKATGRSFAIEGDLSAAWQWPRPTDGWGRWIPGITVAAERMVMANPAGFEPPGAQEGQASENPKASSHQADTSLGAGSMGRIAHASASLRLLPLLSRTLVLDKVILTGPDVVLARKSDGSNNWTFIAKGGGSADNPWDVQVDQLILREGRLGYVDAIKTLALRARIDTLDPTSDNNSPSLYGMRFDVEGSYGKAQIKAHGRAGHVLTLRNKVVNFPLEFTVQAGSATAQAQGILANPAALSGIDLKVKLQASSMADLYSLTGLVLPNTPPFQTEGRLVGNLKPERAVWDYLDFKGTVGQSDLAGNLTYTSGHPRPSLKGSMASQKLYLADLGPVVGGSAPGEPQSRPDKVLPSAPFASERWDRMDMDVQFVGQHIIRPKNLPLEDLGVRAVLNAGELRLAPLKFGVAQGQIDSQVVINAHAAPLQAQLRATVQGLQLSALFPGLERMKKSLGRMDGAVALSGNGNSLAQLLGSSNGQARLYVREGTLSKEMLELAALNVGSVIVAKLFGEDKEVHLRCAVADLAIRNGMAETRTMKLSTDEAIVQAYGTIDMAREHIDLLVKPESLKWKFFSLRTPLHVRGPFARPHVGVEPGPLLLRAGAAVVAAAVAPAALALVPITVPAADDDENCAQLLAQAQQAVKSGIPRNSMPR